MLSNANEGISGIYIKKFIQFLKHSLKHSLKRADNTPNLMNTIGNFVFLCKLHTWLTSSSMVFARLIHNYNWLLIDSIFQTLYLWQSFTCFDFVCPCKRIKKATNVINELIRYKGWVNTLSETGSN